MMTETFIEAVILSREDGEGSPPQHRNLRSFGLAALSLRMTIEGA
jgi:hypothetical protein